MFSDDERELAENYSNWFFGRLANSNNRLFHSLKDLSASQDYAEMSFKRCSLSGNQGDCLRNVTFENNTFNDSQFVSFSLINPSINNVDFQFCEFFDFGIKYDLADNRCCGTLSGGNFDGSLFVECRFSNIIFLNCNLVGTCFNKCSFENCSFSMCCLDSTVFQQCLFDNGDWTKLNIEF